MTTEQVQTDFIFEEMIISPLTKIISELENRTYSDKDLNFLNKKVSVYTKLAADTLNIKINFGKPVDGILNEYTTNKFISYFKTLLKYFSTF